MEKYPQYRLEHFYSYSFREGGLTLQQAHILFLHSMERESEKEYQRMKFIANIMGANIDDSESKNQNKDVQQDLDKKEKEQDLPLFRDPSEYDEMSNEEREKLTNQMMSKHKKWVNNQDKLGNKKPKSKI